MVIAVGVSISREIYVVLEAPPPTGAAISREIAGSVPGAVRRETAQEVVPPGAGEQQ
ncbi:hypothetical protein GCM10027444_07420 [Actinopolyspora lacussalsi]